MTTTPPAATRQHPAATAPATARPAPRSRRVPSAVAAVTFAAYTALALRKHMHFQTTGYDLGIFGQAVRSYAELRLPSSEIRTATGGPGLHGAGFPLLGDHFHPILATLAPLYRLLPHIEVLLVAQTALVAYSAYVITRAAARHLGHLSRWAAPCLGSAYALSWPLQQLIGFDFHEVAFAVPLLALALAAYLDGRWTAAAGWAAPLLLVKEDMGLTVLAFGLLLLRHHRRAGAVLCVLGPAAMALTVCVIIPHFNPDGSYAYLAPGTSGDGPLAPLSQPWEAVRRLVTPGTKALTVLMLLLPSALLAPRSPLVLLAAPTLLWRLASDNPAYWGTQYHYSAILAPIVFAALIDALTRISRSRPRHGPTLTRTVTAAVPAIALVATAGFPLSQVATTQLWQGTARTAAGQAALDRIPDGARVMASNSLAPHLTDRATVYLTAPGVLQQQRRPIDWIIADTTDRWPQGWAKAVLHQATAAGYEQIFAEHGYLVLHRQQHTAR
ncbi:DUF2079 domain-containing protein [Streptomyces sp. RGM 3693]|uniref:DUF2079 domain-containing protein n=1 Tax=Streptomyces sp. RGM 3693 TaxID=3413284 RepID=UPI003D2AE7E9